MIALLEQNQLLNPNLSKQEINNLKKSESTFNRMLKELAVLHECIETNNLHLAEFKLSVGTRKVLKEIRENNQQISDISLLVEATTDPVSTADTSKNILSLINKFHTDNKQYLDDVGSDERLKDTSIPKNIGAEPSIIQKAALKTKELGGKAGQIAMTLFQSIVVNALSRFENWTSKLKSDILDAKKQGSAWKMIMTKLGPSMKIAKRAADGTITYENDSSGTSMLNKLQDFVRLNPKWSNTIIGLLINFTKMLSMSALGAAAGKALVISVLVGLLVRTVVGHYLKKESWKDAFKNALLVTGLSLVGGALTKGLFSYFKGGGFIDGVKSYFVGTGVEDQATPVSPGFVKVSEADVTKLMVSDRRGGDEKLLAFIYKTPALLKAFKQEATENSFTDIKTFIRLQDRDELAYIINNAGGMPKEALTLVAQSGIPTNVANKVDPVKAVKATNANVATTGITDYTSKPLKEIGKLALQGDAKATDAYLEKFMKSGPLGLDQYRIMVKAHDAGIIDKNQFFSGVGPRSLNLNAELRGHIPIKINGISVIDKLTPQEAKTAYDAMSVAKMMGNAVDEDTLAKLATKAGKSVATTVKESTYMSLVKKLYI